MAKKKKPIGLRVRNKLWNYAVRFTKNTPFKYWIYKSWWHYIFHSNKVNLNFEPTDEMYYGARINYFAGIGHQLANWIDGLHWAENFGMKHVNLPFSNPKWEALLGFSNGEVSINQLKAKGYMVRRIPPFGESNQSEIDFVKRIMSTYIGKKVVFWPPQDHFYRDMYGVGEELRRRWDAAPSRKNDKIVYDKSKFNIAMHVRRTVVIDGQTIIEEGENKAKRWLANNYYEKVLTQVLESIKPSKPIAIYIFSTGKAEEFAEFKKYGDVHFCSDMDEYMSFAHLVYADLLITSKSSFSYKPALMNTGIKVCPGNFWHGYPQDDPKWILCENDGSLDTKKLAMLFSNDL